MFFPLSHVLLLPLCCSPKLTSARLISAWQFTQFSTHAHTQLVNNDSSFCRWYSCMLGKKCSLAPLKEELRKQGVSTKQRQTHTNTSASHFFWSQFVHAGRSSFCAGSDYSLLKQSLLFWDCGGTQRNITHQLFFDTCQLSSIANKPRMSWFLLAVHDWITRPSVDNMH